MALINKVKAICDRLAPLGWGDLLNTHGLNIRAASAAALEQQLLRDPVTVQRDQPGFEDFAPDGRHGIEPGQPSLSLLYHALASPLVHPPSAGGPPGPDAYPTLEDLDTVENYIFAAAGRKLSDVPGAVVAVFAYQYRSGSRSPHGLFADMAYARTGIARVGTAADHYDPARRSFWVEPANGGDAIAVMPARYGAFLALRRHPRPGDVILDEDAADQTKSFLFPVHKLFAGTECLADAAASLRVSFAERHVNQKPQRLHSEKDLTVVAGFDSNRPPFVRDSTTGGGMVALRPAGASILVVPEANATLVRTATQKNSVSNREEIIRFLVPPEDAGGNNRFWTSFQAEATGQTDPTLRIGRTAPTYVNIRHEVKTVANGTQTVLDLNQTIKKDPDFLKRLKDGKFEAAHFIDDTCDGCLVAQVAGLPVVAETVAAYSLVTAPHFFPLVDQIAIADWVKRVLGQGHQHDQFFQGEPFPLSDGRRPANVTLMLPDGSGPAFQRTDDTITAVVGSLTSSADRPGRTPNVADLSVNYLPDAASNEFEPGWDVSVARDQQGLEFYAAYGLGSPFPEDSKLCAALNSFWPAAAPDATRTFGPENVSPTAMPLLDGEMGYHPDHPRVRAGEVTSRPGWDGELGPFFEVVGNTTVFNCASKDRSDYTSNALAGLIRVSGLADVSAAEVIARMEALRACIKALPPSSAPPVTVSQAKYFLVTAEPVADWAARPDRGDPRLSGKGYLYEFVLPGSGRFATQPADTRRRRFKIRANGVFTAQVTATAVCWQQGKGLFHFANAV